VASYLLGLFILHWKMLGDARGTIGGEVYPPSLQSTVQRASIAGAAGGGGGGGVSDGGDGGDGDGDAVWVGRRQRPDDSVWLVDPEPPSKRGASKPAAVAAPGAAPDISTSSGQVATSSAVPTMKTPPLAPGLRWLVIGIPTVPRPQPDRGEHHLVLTLRSLAAQLPTDPAHPMYGKVSVVGLSRRVL
jgi:hypothetical protein